MSKEPKMNYKKVMPAPTAWLFEKIQANPLTNPFILIGGTALSLHIAHRISEDLDLITLLPNLPRAGLKELQRQLEASGHQITHHINQSAYDDFQISGMEMADHQQDWVVDGVVKVTFFSAEPQHAKLLSQTHSEKKAGPGFKIASLQELCQLKATVTASRSKSRDWLDLFILEQDHQFGVAKWKEAFDQAGLTPMHFEIAMNRMCKGKLDDEDEGYSALLQNPPSIKELQTRFGSLKADYEKALAMSRVNEMTKLPKDKHPDTPSNP